MDDILYSYWLQNIPHIGNASIAKLLTYAGSPKDVWLLSEHELNTLNLKKEQIDAINRSKNISDIETGYSKMKTSGIDYYPYSHESFPKGLLSIHNPPLGLYVKGKLPSENHVSVAIVGARSCSDYGRYVARKLGVALGHAGIQVISGLARGIDSISQKGVLDSGGSTFAVLGNGVDICYPPENCALYEDIPAHGGLISEYAPHTPAHSAFFPMRNRLISGMSDVIVVIEAKEKSGSLITADFALEQGREVYALPGRVTDSLSHGCNRLIRQGAGIILSPEEFIEDLKVNYSIHAPCSAEHQLPDLDTVPLTEADKKILSELSATEPKTLTDIQLNTQLSAGVLSKSLLSLTMKNVIIQRGSYYLLT